MDQIQTGQRESSNKTRRSARTHRDLDVWKEGIDLVVKIYRALEGFPAVERYGLINQVTKSAISIPSNIAEGAARNSSKEFLQFLYIALGSAAELETQLIISMKVGYLSDEELFKDLERIKSKLLGLIRSIKGKQNV